MSLETLIKNLTTALEENTKALNQNAEAQANPANVVPAAPDEPEEAPVDAPAKQKGKGKAKAKGKGKKAKGAIDEAALRGAINDAVENDNREAVLEVLQSFDADKLSELDESNYKKAYKKLVKLA